MLILKDANQVRTMRQVKSYRSCPRESGRRKRFVDEVSCAYCGGGGADPEYRSASGCPVRRSAGIVRVTPPVVTCPGVAAPAGWGVIWSA